MRADEVDTVLSVGGSLHSSTQSSSKVGLRVKFASLLLRRSLMTSLVYATGYMQCLLLSHLPTCLSSKFLSTSIPVIMILPFSVIVYLSLL